MQIIKKENTCWLEDIPVGATCEIPSLKQDTIFLVVEDEYNEDNPAILVDLESGTIYREHDLIGDFEDIAVVPIQCCVEQLVEKL